MCGCVCVGGGGGGGVNYACSESKDDLSYSYILC